MKLHKNFCPNCSSSTTNGKCKHCKNLPPFFAIGERSELLDEIIHQFKYSSSRALSKPLAEMLNSCLPVIKGPVIIVPLPTIDKHIRERGFDHTLLLAKQISKLHQNWKVENFLLRNGQSVQVGSTKLERKKQADQAYNINPKIKTNDNYTYLLLDDVWTTGSSMLSAYKKLQQAGVSKVIIGVLAVSRLEN